MNHNTRQSRPWIVALLGGLLRRSLLLAVQHPHSSTEWANIAVFCRRLITVKVIDKMLEDHSVDEAFPQTNTCLLYTSRCV